jgi:hypothetical protein
MSASDVFENDVLRLIVWGDPIANIADNAAVAPLAQYYLALHTADPTEAGTQDDSETAYTGYTRIAIPRSILGFTISGGGAGNVASLADDFEFPVCLGVPGADITHASIGVALAGATKILLLAAIVPNIVMAVGAIPRLTTGTTFTVN